MSAETIDVARPPLSGDSSRLAISTRWQVAGPSVVAAVCPTFADVPRQPKIPEALRPPAALQVTAQGFGLVKLPFQTLKNVFLLLRKGIRSQCGAVIVSERFRPAAVGFLPQPALCAGAPWNLSPDKLRLSDRLAKFLNAGSPAISSIESIIRRQLHHRSSSPS